MVLELGVDLYHYFGLSIDSSLKEIKKAYKLKAKELHPDKNRDDPKAKERFQKLKEYHDILLDPILKKEYDKKIKAKHAAEKRHSELNAERRLLKEELERREKEAAARREEANKMAESEKVAERIRKEWEAEQERLRQDQVQERKISARLAAENFVVSIKWSKAHGANTYTKDFIRTCLQEFGNVLNLVVGKKCSAIVEFATRREAEFAIGASSVGTVGYPQNPLKIFWSGGVPPPNTSPLPSFSHSKRKNSPSVDYHHNLIPENMSFESFEADILAKMARFG